jgi:hypothetical protein
MNLSPLRSLLPFLILWTTAWAGPEAQLEETYLRFKTSIADGNRLESLMLSQENQSIYVDALWDLAFEGRPEALTVLRHLELSPLSTAEKVRVALLRLQAGMIPDIDEDLAQEILNQLQNPEPDRKLRALIQVHGGELRIPGLTDPWPEVGPLTQRQPQVQLPSPGVVDDLFNLSRIPLNFQTGRYSNGIQLFLFCRKSRNYPCLMALKDSRGRPVRDLQGKLWTHPALASSALNLPSSVRNGHTPEGVYTIDGVMPTTDNRFGYGSNRRLILNFIRATIGERLLLSLLPDSSTSENWWRASVIGRDVGRTDLRIHGTGEINMWPGTPWYPYIRTAGCVAQLEGTYNGVTYNHQRILLDKIMLASNLAPTYANEARIRGIFYVIDIDDERSPVKSEDLERFGVK